jgi:hypothetical protein
VQSPGTLGRVGARPIRPDDGLDVLPGFTYAQADLFA